VTGSLSSGAGRAVGKLTRTGVYRASTCTVRTLPLDRR